MLDPTFASARSIATAIQARRISATEVMEAHLARISVHNPRLNAIVTLDEEGARKQAHAADVALARDDVWGPLHGVPVTLKDGHATAGMRTTVGIEALGNHVPGTDSTIAVRLKRAGAIIIGKTNVPVRLRDLQTSNPIFGRTNNPWNLERTPGGSSGGAAAALAAGLIPLEIGSDAGGSIRMPAHFCGIYGFKPTERTVPITGSHADPPAVPRNFRLLFSVGPMARDVDDLMLAYRIIAGPDDWDTEIAPLSLADEPPAPLNRLRIAWTPTFPGVPVAADIRKAIEQFAEGLSRMGTRVEERLPAIDFGAERQLFSDLMTWISRAFQPGEPTVSLAAYLEALNQRDEFIVGWERFFEDCDALLCPTVMCPAFPHCEPGTPIKVDDQDVPYWTALGHACRFNLTGHPAAVIPIALSKEGLPIGVQVVGRRWADMRLLAIAKVLAQATDGYRKPGGF